MARNHSGADKGFESSGIRRRVNCYIITEVPGKTPPFSGSRQTKNHGHWVISFMIRMCIHTLSRRTITRINIQGSTNYHRYGFFSYEAVRQDTNPEYSEVKQHSLENLIMTTHLHVVFRLAVSQYKIVWWTSFLLILYSSYGFLKEEQLRTCSSVFFNSTPFANNSVTVPHISCLNSGHI
jgi:hypothetical protein